MNKAVVSTVLAMAATIAMAQTNLTGRAKMLQRTGGYVTQEIEKDAKVILLVDSTEKNAAELRKFQEVLLHETKLPSVIGTDSPGAVIKIVLEDSGDIAVNLTDSSAEVPVGKDSQATQANLWKAMLAIFASDTTIMTQEGMMLAVRTLTSRGFKPIRRTTYRQACEEGWAPSPTNDFQRAIWDAARATVTNAPSKKGMTDASAK